MPCPRDAVAALSAGAVLMLALGVLAAPAALAEGATGAEQPLDPPPEEGSADTAPEAEPDVVDDVTVAAAPRIGSARAGDEWAAVSWSAPASTGGTPILGYVVTALPSGSTVRVGPATTAARVVGLHNGVATRLRVTAVNAAGPGAPSLRSDRVTPRRPARLIVRRQPSRRVVYGGKTRVTAALRTVAGAAVAGKQVNLLARVSPSAHWRRVASGTTGARGRVTLPVSVSATSALRLRHPASSVRAGDAAVRRVAVAKRVTVAAAGTRTRMGAAVTVRGRVAPGQRVGSRVRLQRRVSGSWTSIASGRMTTRQRFAIRWEPTRVGGHVLRVARAGGSVRATGYSARWRHRIIAESAADIASDILRNGAITLATVHVGGIRDQATPEQNIVDTAAGRAARRSCHGNAPCGSVAIDLRVLRAIRAMGAKTTITVSEINGGHHAGGSAHYSGRAVDITWVNDRHVYRGTAYGMAVDVCRTHGASQILTPSNDPWGGHSNHVHCGWS